MKKNYILITLLLLLLVLTGCDESVNKDESDSDSSAELENRLVEDFVDNAINVDLANMLNNNGFIDNIPDFLTEKRPLLSIISGITNGTSIISEITNPMDFLNGGGFGDGITIINQDTLTATMGLSQISYTDTSVGVFFDVSLDDHCRKQLIGGEEGCKYSFSGDYESEVIARNPFNPQIGIKMNTAQPLSISDADAGELDGASLEFDNYNIWFSITMIDGVPVPMIQDISGTILVNGNPVDLSSLSNIAIDQLLNP